MRSVVLGLGALLVAGIAGLVSAEAQTGGARIPVQELRRVGAFEQEMMGKINRLLALAEQNRDGKAEVKVIIETKAIKSVFETRAVVFAAPTITAEEMVLVKSKLNTRINNIMRSGRLTPMDRRLLEQTTFTGLKREVLR